MPAPSATSLQAAERADAHAVAELDVAFEDHVDVDLDVAPDADLAAHVEARRIGEAHALRAQRARRAQLERAFELRRAATGSLAPSASSGSVHDARISAALNSRGGLREHVGQVVLALRVVVATGAASQRCSAVARRRR